MQQHIVAIVLPGHNALVVRRVVEVTCVADLNHICACTYALTLIYCYSLIELVDLMFVHTNNLTEMRL